MKKIPVLDVVMIVKKMYLYNNTLKGDIKYINIYCTIFKLAYVARNIFNSTMLKRFLLKSGKV